MKKLPDLIDKRYAKICAYASVTVLLTLVAGMVLYFSSGFFVNLWLLICAVLEPAVYGALVSYLLNPAVIFVSHALKNAGWRSEDYRLRRIIGIVVCFLALALLAVAILVVMMLVIQRSIEGISVEAVEAFYSDAQGDLQELLDTLQGLAVQTGFLEGEAEAGSDVGSMLAGMFRHVTSVGSTMVFSFIFAVYYLMDGDHVGGYVRRVVRAALGEKGTARMTAFLEDADHVFSGYIRGQFMDALVVGLLAAIVLTLAGVPYGPVVGLLTGLGNFIPYVGAPLGIASTVLFCIADGTTNKIVLGVICLAVIMFVDSNIINPKLLSDNVEVHPLLVVAALIAGGAVGGLAGMLVAVPAAALLKMYVDRWLASREEGEPKA